MYMHVRDSQKPFIVRLSVFPGQRKQVQRKRVYVKSGHLQVPLPNAMTQPGLP